MPVDPPKQAQPRSKIGTDIHLLLQQRDLTLLKTLSLLRIVDREQARVICGFNSLTRVNSRLLKLTRAGLLKRFFFVGELGGKRAVYSLSRKGADLIGIPTAGLNRPQDSFLIGDRYTAHTLAVGQVYCMAFCTGSDAATAENWQGFQKAVSPAVPVVPDGYFEIHTKAIVRPMFLEVDLGTEGLPVWNKKIMQYRQLAASGEFERLFSRPRFAVLVVAASERRMHSLRKETSQITSKLFYFSTLHRIEQQGFWSASWFRPEGEQTQPLI